MEDADEGMGKETKRGEYLENPTWLLSDCGDPGGRNFSNAPSGPTWHIPDSPTIAQLNRIVNPTSKKSKKEESAIIPKLK